MHRVIQRQSPVFGSASLADISAERCTNVTAKVNTSCGCSREGVECRGCCLHCKADQLAWRDKVLQGEVGTATFPNAVKNCICWPKILVHGVAAGGDDARHTSRLCCSQAYVAILDHHTPAHHRHVLLCQKVTMRKKRRSPDTDIHSLQYQGYTFLCMMTRNQQLVCNFLLLPVCH
jgi:hypothetical protein